MQLIKERCWLINAVIYFKFGGWIVGLNLNNSYTVFKNDELTWLIHIFLLSSQKPEILIGYKNEANFVKCVTYWIRA